MKIQVLKALAITTCVTLISYSALNASTSSITSEIKTGAPFDEDEDGVVDWLDKCPGTPPNTIVDSDGCPIFVR